MGTTSAPNVRRSAGAGAARRPRTAALAWAGAALTAALLLPVWPALRISDGGDTMGYLDLAEGEPLTISYVHSIDHLPIEENLVVRDGRLVVDSTRLRQFGAGMGQIPGEGTGRADGEWWVVENMGRDIGTELTIRVGAPAVDHRIRTPGAEVRLSPCLAAHRVHVRPVRLPTLLLPFSGVPAPEC
ncbi:DUF1850 domain-containing protein [Nocardiopsis sp. CT-R113]|uniref:DUF1850 domain-containing protein n=1 Tax=Nocardiopsis codii TaxID=3065942 RepID=A0ABU7K2Z4_9ACTN|nr:DUF1850 domain-containing protein [Nocardiopsis sp. CT-R113]MEE2036442.1 DUF1850 domain-containing protein [Nocardiopsis sp. CT-R113]